MSQEVPNKQNVNTAVQIFRAVLVISAMLMLVGMLSIAGMYYMNRPETIKTFILSFGAVMGGLLTAVLLLSISSIIGLLSSNAERREASSADDVRPALERLEQSLRMLNNLQTRADAVRDQGAAATHHAAQQSGLDQLRDLTLMDDAQRKRYAAAHWARKKQYHLEAIEREVLVGDWRSAFLRLEEMQIVMVDDADIAAMRERVESEQSARLEEDLRVARARLRHLTGSAMWQQAEDLAESVQSKYPGKPEATRLIEEVRREREAWERENMDRLFRDIAVATERRQWRHASLAVDEFIRRYPLDPRAEALRLDLPTLQENAAAHERKEQEEHFKDLLKRQRYEEAAQVARAVIHKFPHSPTATELNKLLPRVEEMARQEASRAAQGVPA